MMANKVSLALKVIFLAIIPSASYSDSSQFVLDFRKIETGLLLITSIKNAGDNSSRLFITEREGLIHILKDGNILKQPFLDIDHLTQSVSEHGLFSTAFHPNFSNNGYFYVSYSTRLNEDPEVNKSFIVRYQLSEQDENLANQNSAQVILTIDQPFGNHNGGEITFGPDGYLYASFGDGGGSGDPDDQAQNKNSLLGKIIRIDVDVSSKKNPGSCASHAGTYSVPDDNPFITTPGACNEIWALGLRNPFKMSFDNLTQDLFISDVGQNRVEEINVISSQSTGGLNFGWDCKEGSTSYGQAGDPGEPSPECTDNTLIDPIIEYEHFNGRCSITGGYRYRGSEPALQGLLFFADLCTNEVFTSSFVDGVWQTNATQTQIGPITSFGQDEQNNLFVASYRNEIYQVVNDLVFKSSFQPKKHPSF